MLRLATLLLPALAVAQQAQQPMWNLGGPAASQFVWKTAGNPQTASGASLELGSDDGARKRVRLDLDYAAGRGVSEAPGPRGSVYGRRRTSPGGRHRGCVLMVPAGMIMIDNGQDRSLKGTGNGRIEVTIVVPPEATSIVVGVLMSGSGEAKVSGLRAIAGPLLDPSAALAPLAQLTLDFGDCDCSQKLTVA